MADQTTHVLLIEDEADHAELIRRAFEAHAEGTRLTVVSTLCEARAILKETLPDLVIADIRLPDGSGMEILAGGEEDALFPTCGSGPWTYRWWCSPGTAAKRRPWRR